MSISVIKEMEFLIQSIICGICITFVYDWLKIFRNLWKHSNVIVSIEDAIYWIGCSVFVFSVLHQENNGILRWFVVIGAAIGMLIYKTTISRYFVKTITGIGHKGWQATSKLKRPASFIKKKLTEGLKLFKMMINKQ